jgi:hypothetical protein
MAYIYQVNFQIRPDQMSELQVGAGIQRVMYFLRSLLPASQGYMTTRVMYSIDESEHIDLVFQSVWDRWSDLEAHRKTRLVEEKAILEFGPHLSDERMRVRVFREVD